MTKKPAKKPVKKPAKKPAKASVYHDPTGRIVAIVVAETSVKGPSASIAAPAGSKLFEIELSGELAGVHLLHLHRHYRVDSSGKEPRLVRTMN